MHMEFNFEGMIKTLEDKYAKFNEQRTEKLSEIERIKSEIAGIDTERARIEGEYRLLVDLKKMKEAGSAESVEAAETIELVEAIESVEPVKPKVKSVK